MDFAEESKVEDIIYFAEIFRYAKRSGGDLISIIRNTTQIIQQKEEVLSEIDTIISGKRMEQRVMSIIPAAIVVYLKFTAAEFIQPLYGNVYGAVMMTEIMRKDLEKRIDQWIAGKKSTLIEEVCGLV